MEIIDKIKKIKYSRLSPPEQYIFNILEDSYSKRINDYRYEEYLFFQSKTIKNRYGYDKEYFTFIEDKMKLYAASYIWEDLQYIYKIKTYEEKTKIIGFVFTMYTNLITKEIYRTMNY